MEFGFDINGLFHETIALVTSEQKLPRRNTADQFVKNLEHVIDTIGIRSANAQNLSAPITSWVKLRINNHRIYILKDAAANNDHGSVIGFIKTGRKQLFILDRDGTHNEMHPLCVLDFYIHESQQRKGYGLKLYKHMLQAEGVEPAHLAVDRPSAKFTSFLRKHFHLWATLPQVNNFVVFDGFFKNRKDPRRSKYRRGSSQREFDDFRPLSRAVSDNVIKRTRQTNFGLNDSFNGLRPLSGSTINGRGEETQYSKFSRTGQGARANMFSRFAADENAVQPPKPLPTRRSRSHLEEEIVTNPYRRVTNTHSKQEEHRQKRDMIGKLRRKDNAVLAEGGNSPITENFPKWAQASNHSNSTTDETAGSDRLHWAAANASTKNKAEEKNVQDLEPIAGHEEPCQAVEDKPPKRTMNGYSHFLANDPSPVDPNSENAVSNFNPFMANRPEKGNVSQNSVPVEQTKYKTPSDMILELQKKDGEKRDAPTPQRRYSQQSLFGSSWNVFGVPSSLRVKQQYQS